MRNAARQSLLNQLRKLLTEVVKILFSLTYYHPYISGLSVHVQKVAEGLKNRGYKVKVVTSQYEKSLKKIEDVDGIIVVRVPYLIKFHKGIFMPAWLLTGIKEIFWADVVICNLPQPESIYLLLLARLLKKKAIIVYHCDVNLPKGFLNLIAEKFLHILNLLSCRLADSVISTSEDYAMNSPILKNFSKKTFYVFPPIKDLTSLKINQEEKKELLSFFKGVQLKIGFVGRIAADKGMEYLIEAIPYLKKRLKSFKIFLVGSKEAVGEQTYVEKINFLARKYKDYVCLLGKLTDNQLAWFYKNIDVFVLPSVNSTEAFGTVQVEAMLFGVPVVVSNLPGVRTAVKLTRMGKIVSIRDSKDISDAITEVSRDKTELEKSKKIVRDNFSLGKTIDGYEELFKI